MSKNEQRGTLVTAHSGPDGTLDNSLENILYVLQTNADAMELDIRRDQKGELVLSHDPVKDGDKPLTLKEAFEIISQHPTMKINCDLKVGNLEHDVYKLGCDFQLQDRLIYSGSADPEQCKDLPITLYLNLEYFFDPAIDGAMSEALLESSTREEVWEFLTTCMDSLPSLKAHSLNMYYAVFDKAFEDGADASRYPFSLWTVDNLQDIRRHMKVGVQAITTRRLKEALELRDSLET